MGGHRVKVQNLEIVKVLPEDHVLIVKGSVPGAKGSIVYVDK
jgi:large subunit ribosomal protein L3